MREHPEHHTMNVILFGASGMIGHGVLLECLDDPGVTKVLAIGRTPCGVTHEKLEEILHHDFYDFGALAGRLAGYDACFFCLGVSSAGMSEADYTRITFDIAAAAARAVLAASPAIAFCFISGQGTNAEGSSMWARVKGRTENHLLAMPFRQATMFRPGFIQPLRGITSKTPLYRAVYAVFGPLFPVLSRLFPGSMTTTVRVGRAMLHVARHGAPKRVLETTDINALAALPG
jgi:uncharacterized protein YbjT (DUF2867 family)